MVTLPAPQDLDFVYRLAKECGDRYYPLVSYKKLVFDSSVIDDVHMEVSEVDKHFEDPINVRAYVTYEAESQKLENFGLETVRIASLLITVPHMVECGLANQDSETKVITKLCRIGDRFVYFDMVFDVIEIVINHLWANTQIPIDYKFRAIRFRPDSSIYAGM